MKRELLHPACDRYTIGVTINTNVFDLAEQYATGEKITRVRGQARGTYCCDCCGLAIDSGSPVVALSISTNAVPYYEWEHDYVAREGATL